MRVGDGSAPWLRGSIVGDSLYATLCPGGLTMFFGDYLPTGSPSANGTLTAGLPAFAAGMPVYGDALVFGTPADAVVGQLPRR